MKRIALYTCIILFVLFLGTVVLGCGTALYDCPDSYCSSVYEQGTGESDGNVLGALPDSDTNTLVFLIAIAGAALLATVTLVVVNVHKNEKTKKHNK